MTVEAVLFGLIRGVVCGETVGEDLKNACTEELLERVYTLAKKHDLAHLVGQAVSKMSLPESETVKKAKDAAMSAFMRYMRLDYAYQQACEVLEEGQLPFLPLKGAVLRRLYPEAWLRTSCDIDILVREGDLDRAVALLAEKLSCVPGTRDRHDIALQCPGGVHLELHFDLVEEGRANAASGVLRRVWEDARPKEGRRYWYEMSDGLFYFYHIAHMAKHFESGGCGIRPFLDLWLLDRSEILRCAQDDGESQGLREGTNGLAAMRTAGDACPYSGLLEEGGLLTFAQAARKLSRVWFSGEQVDALSEKLQDFLLHGGVYGSSKNRVALQREARGGKLGYLCSRVFAPYEKLKSYYPVLEKHRWLMPAMQVRRWFMLCRPSVARMAKNELAANRTESNDTGSLLDALGIQDSAW